MKETYYFSHDYNASSDPKLLELFGECGLAGIGFYWVLIEHLHSDPSGKLSKSQFHTLLRMYGVQEGEHLFNKIEQVLNSTGLLLTDDDGKIYSNRVMEHKKERERVSAVRSFAGKKSAEARANPTSVQHYKGKERKRKEIKINTKDSTSKEVVISTYKEVFKVTRCVLTPKRVTMLNSRLKMFSVDEIIVAIRNFGKSPWHTGKNDRGWIAPLDFIIKSDEQIERGINLFDSNQPDFKKMTNSELLQYYKEHPDLLEN